MSVTQATFRTQHPCSGAGGELKVVRFRPSGKQMSDPLASNVVFLVYKPYPGHKGVELSLSPDEARRVALWILDLPVQ